MTPVSQTISIPVMALSASSKKDLSMSDESNSLKLHLSSQGLNRIESLPSSSDFSFIVCGHHYRCSKFSACFLSQKVFRALCSDFTMSSIDLGNISVKVFEAIFGVMTVGEPEISNESLDEALKICGELENDELSSQISSKLLEGQGMMKENVVSRLKLKCGLGLNFSSELSFIASHLYEFESNVLKEVGISLCEEMLSSECLVVENEDSLLRMIVSNGDEYENLLCYVDCQYLTDSGICEYIEAISIENITLRHWESICRRLRHHIDISHDLPRFRVATKRKVVSHPYSNNPFDGILNSLHSSCGRNPHDAGEVVISASSSLYNQPQQVVIIDRGVHKMSRSGWRYVA
jgi:hypothetical protein